jgi:hypothetical protein
MGEIEIRKRRSSKAANAAVELRCQATAREILPGSNGCLLGQGRGGSLLLAAAVQELKNPFLLLPNSLRVPRAAALHIKCKSQHRTVVGPAVTVMENGFTSS